MAIKTFDWSQVDTEVVGKEQPVVELAKPKTNRWLKAATIALCVIAGCQAFNVVRDLYVYYKINQAVTNVKDAIKPMMNPAGK